MPVQVLINGYNLIGARREGLGDIEAEREALIEELSAYRRVRKVKLTVVFDNRALPRLNRTKEFRNGVEVVFSGSNEDADTVIKGLAGHKGNGVTVVTSDREVASFARSKGAVVIDSGEFGFLLGSALYEDLKGGPIEEEDGDNPKKGPSRRPSKKERQKINRLKKL